MEKLNTALYDTGREAYERGENVAQLAERAIAIENDPVANEDGTAIPSLFLGFLNGIVADIRAIKGATR